MFDRKEAKKRAKTSLKKHYIIFVMACLLAAFLGCDYTENLAMVQSTTGAGDTQSVSVDTVLNELLEGKLASGSSIAEKINERLKARNIKIGKLEFGHAKGVLSSVVNGIGSGSYLVVVYKTILNMVESPTAAAIIFGILVLIVYLAFRLLIVDAFTILYHRIFLEAFSYDKVPISRYSFLFRVKKWFKAPLIIFVKDIYQVLWNLTIVGGVIKRYSYYLVPYIAAENPDLTPNQAITLSRKMMDGHKWEAFVLDISFIGWSILSIFTFGLLNVFFASPYMEATILEYYVCLRTQAFEKNVEGVEVLQDTYLYQHADQALIHEVYADVVILAENPIEYVKHTGFKGFLENNFGIVFNYTEEDEIYNQAIAQETVVSDYHDIENYIKYPSRLDPTTEYEKKSNEVNYMRRYSIWSIILLFFSFAFVGWIWEVCIHIVKDGKFVNRGVLHGPWLPIYGAGGVMILVLLYKVRKKPALTLILGIILCGIVEYVAATILWHTQQTKWWDYSGYFLNINGRICAEGLLVFGLAGLAAVYFAAPMLDNQFKKIPKKVIVPLCIVLLAIFVCDAIYSHYYPNKGKGITDYGTQEGNKTNSLLTDFILQSERMIV